MKGALQLIIDTFPLNFTTTEAALHLLNNLHCLVVHPSYDYDSCALYLILTSL